MIRPGGSLRVFVFPMYEYGNSVGTGTEHTLGRIEFTSPPPPPPPLMTGECRTQQRRNHETITTNMKEKLPRLNGGDLSMRSARPSSTSCRGRSIAATPKNNTNTLVSAPGNWESGIGNSVCLKSRITAVCRLDNVLFLPYVASFHELSRSSARCALRTDWCRPTNAG